MLIDYKNQKLISTEEINTQQVEFNVRQAKLQLQADILKTEQLISEGEAKLKLAKQTYPFDSEHIIDSQLELEAYQEGLKRLKGLEKELFN
jgi:hypothetical protein